MTDLFGIPNCDTCRKARKWFDQQNIAYTFHDVREEGLTQKQVQNWLKQIDDKQLVNTRSTTWRSLAESQRKKLGTQTARLLVDNPTLLKRPLVISGNHYSVGYVEDSWKLILK